jgi:hypothetical protein
MRWSCRRQPVEYRHPGIVDCESNPALADLDEMDRQMWAQGKPFHGLKQLLASPLLRRRESRAPHPPGSKSQDSEHEADCGQL